MDSWLVGRHQLEEQKRCQNLFNNRQDFDRLLTAIKRLPYMDSMALASCTSLWHLLVGKSGQGHWVWNRNEKLSAHNFLMKTSSRDAPQKFSSTLSKAFKILSHPTPIPIAMLQKWRQCFIFCVIVCPQLQCNLSTCLNLVEGLLTLHEKIWSDFSWNIHESTRETNSGNRKRSFPFKTASLSFWRKTSCSSHRRWWYAGKKRQGNNDEDFISGRFCSLSITFGRMTWPPLPVMRILLQSLCLEVN